MMYSPRYFRHALACRVCRFGARNPYRPNDLTILGCKVADAIAAGEFARRVPDIQAKILERMRDHVHDGPYCCYPY